MLTLLFSASQRFFRSINFSRALTYAGVCVLAVCTSLPVQATQLEELFETEQYPEFLAQARTAAQAGDTDALFLLVKAHHLGHGVEKNILTARGYYLKADAQGSARAAHNLGMLALDEQRNSDAIVYFKRALARGLKQPTLANLGKAYTPPPATDVWQAPQTIWFLRLAADAYAQAWEQEPSAALANEASGRYLQAYLIARAVPQENIAPFFRTKLAEENDTNLSLESFQTPALRQATKTWLDKGMVENNRVAWTNYGVLLFKEEAFAEAQQAFERGAEQDQAVAYYYLGKIAGEGLVAKPDVKTAAHYFEQSLRLGEERARVKAIDTVHQSLMSEEDVATLECGVERLEALAESDENPAWEIKQRLQWARHFVELREQAHPLPAAPLYLRACGLRLDQVHGNAFNLGKNLPWRLVAYQSILELPKRWESLEGLVNEQGCAITEEAIPDEVRTLVEKGAQLALWFPNFTL